MAKYSQHLSAKNTPQTEPVIGKNQVQNNAGGFVFQITKWEQLNRFLILGSEGGTYYATEKKLTVDNAKNVIECIKENAKKVVDKIVDVSSSGKSAKNDAAIFALALVSAFGDLAGKVYAHSKLNQVCRTGTHIFQFAAACNDLRGWGNGLKKAISNWYLSKNPDELAYQVTKYQQRDGWSHKDLLRLAHTKTNNNELNSVFRWIVDPSNMGIRKVIKGTKEFNYDNELPAPLLIEGFEQVKKATTAKEVVKLINQYKLVREHIPTQFLNTKEVWEALLPNTPLTGLMRNLGNLTKLGLVAPLSSVTKDVVSKLTDQTYLKKSRLHPLSILVALNTYNRGRGVKGDSVWCPVTQVTDALNSAFYLAFDNVEPTNQNYFIGVDCSGSMEAGEINGMTGINPRIAAAAMALVTNKTEKNSHIMGFSTTMRNLGISANMRLDSVVNIMRRFSWGGTDCALPMMYAKENKLEVDNFVVITDNDTYAGRKHPFQALKEYRQWSGRNAKLIVMGMTATGFSIADPSDRGMLDVVGCSTDTPTVMREFCLGNV